MPEFDLPFKGNENRLRRGWILRMLNYFQHVKSRWVNDKLIQSGLQDVGHAVTMPTVHADFHYLAEKGYLEVREPEEAKFTALSAAITAKGIDLYDGTIEDPGVDFGRE